MRPEDMNEEEHRAWLESLSEDESLVVQTPVGYQWLMLNAAYCKRVLQEKEISVGTRLRVLEGLNKITDLYFTLEMLAAIQPMSDTEMKYLMRRSRLTTKKIGRFAMPALMSSQAGAYLDIFGG